MPHVCFSDSSEDDALIASSEAAELASAEVLAEFQRQHAEDTDSSGHVFRQHGIVGGQQGTPARGRDRKCHDR